MTTAASLVDISAVSDIMADICATEMVPQFRNLDPEEVMMKGPNDPVTVVDQACETQLKRRLLELLPNAGFVGEEEYADDKTVLHRLKDPGPVWVVDPLDGTANFAAGREEFGMIVALVVDGITQVGWIHHPLTGESFSAVKGEGTQGLPSTTTAPDRTIDDMTGYFRTSASADDPADTEALRALSKKLAKHGPTRCSAHAYVSLAKAESDFLIYRTLMPWDHAAGILMIEEAGCVCSHIKTGEPYDVSDTYGLLVSARDTNTMEQIAQSLNLS